MKPVRRREKHLGMLDRPRGTFADESELLKLCLVASGTTWTAQSSGCQRAGSTLTSTQQRNTRQHALCNSPRTCSRLPGRSRAVGHCLQQHDGVYTMIQGC